MRFQVITLFPEMIESMTGMGVLGQARDKNLIQVTTLNPRKYTSDVHKTVDDRPYGGGDGMVMLAEPLMQSIAEAADEAGSYIVYMSPQGAPLSQKKVLELATKKNLVLICGRYGGIDQRIINNLIDEEISIGDYVISGGEMAAGVLIDAVSRQIPGVLGHQASASADSFGAGNRGLLEAPMYTRPREFLDESVPEVLLGGHHQKIQEWKSALSVLTTLLKRPDLVLDLPFEKKELQKLKKFWRELSHPERDALGLSSLTDQDLELLQSGDQYRELRP